MDRDALRAAIPTAFGDVPYPGDAAVTSADWATTEECRFFCGKDWRDVDRGVLPSRYADLSFFTPAGFHYLLPAFLLAALDHDSLIPETLRFQVARGHARGALALMSFEQKALLSEFLSLTCAADAELKVALDVLDPGTASPRHTASRR